MAEIRDILINPDGERLTVISINSERAAKYPWDVKTYLYRDQIDEVYASLNLLDVLADVKAPQPRRAGRAARPVGLHPGDSL